MPLRTNIQIRIIRLLIRAGHIKQLLQPRLLSSRIQPAVVRDEGSLGAFDFEQERLVLVAGFAVALGDALAFLPGEAASKYVLAPHDIDDMDGWLTYPASTVFIAPRTVKLTG